MFCICIKIVQSVSIYPFGELLLNSLESILVYMYVAHKVILSVIIEYVAQFLLNTSYLKFTNFCRTVKWLQCTPLEWRWPSLMHVIVQGQAQSKKYKNSSIINGSRKSFYEVIKKSLIIVFKNFAVVVKW